MSNAHLFITGKLHFSPRKITLESGETSYFVRTRSIGQDFVHGDMVKARIVKRGDSSRLSEVDIISLIRHTDEELLGHFSVRDKGYVFQVLKDLGFFEKAYTSLPHGFAQGDIIIWKFDTQGKPIFLEKFASKSDFDIEEKILFALAGVKIDFPTNITKEAELLQSKAKLESGKNISSRRDFRDWYTITIDGADAKDLDDAISLRTLENGNTLLAVHIADVAEYVREGTELDREAYRRATSVYTPGCVVPMLPEALSNDLCSLHPGEPKLTLSCIMEVDQSGHVRHTDIVEGIILSRHRGIYDDIEKNKDVISENPEHDRTITLAYKLFETLKKRRKKEGKIIFESTEVYFDFGEEKREGVKIPIGLRKRSRLDAHMLIEEFMVLANEEVAKWCERHEMPFLSRIHGLPGAGQLEIIRAIVGKMNLSLGKTHEKSAKAKKQIHPQEIRQFLDGIKDERELYRFSRLLLPKMAKAVYADKHLMHFGLALEYYSHFTSPIRRYPDLQIHRIIKEKLQGKLTLDRIAHYKAVLKRVARHCSERERSAEDIERVFDSLYACRYMQDKVGERFHGRISGVTEFAIFIELENGVEGTLFLPKRHYILNQIAGSLETGDGKTLYQIGQDMEVVIDRVDMSEKRIILDIKS